MRVLVAAMLLPLAACGGGESPANNASADEAPVQEASPDNAMVDPTNMVVPLPPAAGPTPVAATTLPPVFQGRWGLVADDCDPARDDAKGLMIVTADRVTHYESRGTPMRIEVASPTKLTAELAFTGEGQEWTRRATWTLQDAGKTLVAETDDPEPPMRALRYARCPA